MGVAEGDGNVVVGLVENVVEASQETALWQAWPRI